MATLRIDSNNNVSTEVTIRESDVYSESVFVKFEKICDGVESHGCNEMFLTPMQLDHLGRFLLRHAEEIRGLQKSRK